MFSKVVVRMRVGEFEPIARRLRMIGIFDFVVCHLSGEDELVLEWWGPDDDAERVETAIAHAAAKFGETDVVVVRTPVEHAAEWAQP